MNPTPRYLTIALLLAAASGPVSAQEVVDDRVNAEIRREAFDDSRVLETARMLTDRFGPRLAGSPAYLAAARWARDRLAAWGLAHATLEPWGVHGPGWNLKGFSVEMTAPYYLRVTAFPRAWTPGTPDPVSGMAVAVDVNSPADFARYRGKLKGAIVLNGTVPPPEPAPENPVIRFSDAQLDSFARLTDPGPPHDYQEEARQFVELTSHDQEIAAFFRSEGALALLAPSPIGAALRVDGYWGYREAAPALPAFIVTQDHYRRIMYLVDQGIPVRLTADLRVAPVTGDSLGYNVVAELPGSDPVLKDEVVMLGAHLDSWLAGTGATDNGAGCAVVMEAMRVLRDIGARPKRTIRVVLWDGEEPAVAYVGSVEYVKRHFGNPETRQLKPEQALISAYFNLDNGTGKIRGIYLQGNEAARPIFTAWLAPFRDLGAATVSISNTGATDHMAFVSVGIPGFQFIQDPLDYDTRTHHTSLDIADYLREDDLKQAAAVLASVVYHAAMRPEKLPRPTH